MIFEEKFSHVGSVAAEIRQTLIYMDDKVRDYVLDVVSATRAGRLSTEGTEATD
jgi:hypothetical protein